MSSGGCGHLQPSDPGAPAGPATVTIPGPGSWNIAVWLTDKAGNETPANAAHTIVNIPGGGSGNAPGGSGPGGSAPYGHSHPKVALHVSEALHGQELLVRVTGPVTGRVRVSFAGRIGAKTVTSRAATFVLKRGRLTAAFTLGPRTAAHAKIRVTVQLDHERPVTSLLHRHAKRNQHVKLSIP